MLVPRRTGSTSWCLVIHSSYSPSEASAASKSWRGFKQPRPTQKRATKFRSLKGVAKPIAIPCSLFRAFFCNHDFGINTFRGKKLLLLGYKCFWGWVCFFKLSHDFPILYLLHAGWLYMKNIHTNRVTSKKMYQENSPPTWLKYTFEANAP